MILDSGSTPKQTAAGAEHVASLLPATALPPDPARRINLLKGLLFYWLMPKRYGPHLAVDSLGRALLAHGAALLAMFACLLWAVAEQVTQSSWQDLRIGLAKGVVELAIVSAHGGMGWVPALLVVGTAPLVEFGFVLLAVLAMPWVAGGDAARSVFRRSLRNVYWSTTALVPAAAIWAGAFRIIEDYKPHGDAELAVVLVAAVLVFIVLVVWLRCVMVGADRYVGQPEGPAFAPREPHCEQCGYLIIGLTPESNCPECGLGVRESLPGGRRRPTRWQERELRPDGFYDLMRLQWRVVVESAFFRQLPVQQGFSAARHFWWGTYALVLLATLGSLRVIGQLPLNRLPELSTAAMVAAGLPLATQAVVMFAACLWAQVRYGIRDYRISAVVCYYAAPFVWGIAMLVPLGVVLSARQVYQLLDIRLSVGRVEGEVTAVALWGLLFLLLLGVWWQRLCRGLQDVRFANS